VSRRTRQVGDQIRAEITRLLLRELHDPRIGFVTITAVEMSPDLRNARVFVSTLQAGKPREETLEALRSATGFLRREIGRNLSLRSTPTIEFRFDKSIETGSRIEELLIEAGLGGSSEDLRTDERERPIEGRQAEIEGAAAAPEDGEPGPGTPSTPDE
jgi:ribosome-binding factor A